MYSLLFSLGISLVNIGLGWKIVSYLDSSKRLSNFEKIIISFFIGGFFIYYGVFFIGLYGLNTTSMSFLGIFGILLSLPGLKLIPWREFYISITHLLKSDPISRTLFVTVAFIALIGFFQGLAPPNDYDGLMYHLSIPLHDVEIGKIIVPSDARGLQALFPGMMSNLTRFSLVFLSGEAAQLSHGIYGIAAMAGTAALVHRLGYDNRTALTAALFFISIRAVIWQIGTVETDLPLSGFLVSTILIYAVWRNTRSPGLGILLGAMIGGMILSKYIGFALALAIGPILVFDMVKTRNWQSGLIGPIVSFVLILPHLIRNGSLTNNPIYPLFNSVFNPNHVDPYSGIASSHGTGRDLIDLITGPWNIFIVPMQYFDGMVIGAPYLLVFAPFIFLMGKNLYRWSPVVSTVGVFYVVWFYNLSQQVRFLIPIMPIIAAMSAAGVFYMWQKVKSFTPMKLGFITFLILLALNQALFIGVYSIIRIPAAFGMISPEQYHSNTPTMNGAFYKTCTYIRKNLKPGEVFYSALGIPSYYCPQSSVAYRQFFDEDPWFLSDGTRKKYTRTQFIKKLEKIEFRYFILMEGYHSRRDNSTDYGSRKNTTATTSTIPLDRINYRFKRFLEPVTRKLEPLSKGPYSAVYDGKQVLETLKESHE